MLPESLRNPNQIFGANGEFCVLIAFYEANTLGKLIDRRIKKSFLAWPPKDGKAMGKEISINEISFHAKYF